ncbi:unnamed protein product, partial [Darwinula stevensoni]
RRTRARGYSGQDQQDQQLEHPRPCRGDIIGLLQSVKRGNSDGEVRSQIHDMTAKIGTHDGPFHCDEALACYMLRCLPQYKNARIVRSRNESLLSTCDIVVDVGGIYDHAKRRYDHHQREFSATMITGEKTWKTTLSSAGLIFYHYGKEIISIVLECLVEDFKVEKVLEKVYGNLIEEIDATDNGIPICHRGLMKYKICTSLSTQIRNLKPQWTDTDKSTDDVFPEAMKTAGDIFIDRVRYYGNVWWPAREMLIEDLNRIYNKLSQVDKSGNILQLSKYYPWREHLLDLAGENLQWRNQINRLAFVIYQTPSKWIIKAIPRSSGRKVLLPEEWGGLEKAELVEKSGLQGIIFVHGNRFIGGHESRDGVISMAKMSLAAFQQGRKRHASSPADNADGGATASRRGCWSMRGAIKKREGRRLGRYIPNTKRRGGPNHLDFQRERLHF